MNATDADALERAIEIARRDPAERRQIDAWLATGRSREDVGKSAACYCQSTALDLAPDDLQRDLPIEAVSCGVPFLFAPLTTRSAVDRASIGRAA